MKKITIRDAEKLKLAVSAPNPLRMPDMAIPKASPAQRRHAGVPDLRALEIFVAVCDASSMVLAAERLGLSQSAMVGDGENDLELIRAAGLGIAMGNAPDSVKQAADLVVRRVEECGLEQALDMLRQLHMDG